MYGVLYVCMSGCGGSFGCIFGFDLEFSHQFNRIVGRATKFPPGLFGAYNDVVYFLDPASTSRLIENKEAHHLTSVKSVSGNSSVLEATRRVKEKACMQPKVSKLWVHKVSRERG